MSGTVQAAWAVLVDQAAGDRAPSYALEVGDDQIYPSSALTTSARSATLLMKPGVAMNPAVAPVISGTVGAVVGFGLRAPFDAYMSHRRDQRLGREEVDKALKKIRDRLYGIKAAVGQVQRDVDPFDESKLGPCKTVRDEVWDLGGEKDEYHRAATSPDPAIEIGLQQILLNHDLAAIDPTLQAVSKRVKRK